MNLGEKGTDIITGFTGTITGYVQYLTGCNQYLIIPKCKKDDTSTKPEGQWIDDSRIKITKNNTVKLFDTKSDGPDLTPPIN